jgi:hypothetical protein
MHFYPLKNDVGRGLILQCWKRPPFTILKAASLYNVGKGLTLQCWKRPHFTMLEGPHFTMLEGASLFRHHKESVCCVLLACLAAQSISACVSPL